jgi:hypothetical protein
VSDDVLAAIGASEMGTLRTSQRRVRGAILGEPPTGLGLAVQADDRQAGAEEGAKDRPCALVSATVKEAGRRILVVVPITHSSPIDAAAAIEISAVTNVPTRA